MEKLKKLVALTASVKIEAGESASFLNETKISIGLAGDPSAGKSSLLNALLGTAAMPMAGISCTAYPVKVQKVPRSEQQHKYKLVLPQPADLRGAGDVRVLVENALNYFTGKSEAPENSRIVETDDIQVVYGRLNEDFKKLISGSKLCYHVNAELMVAEDDPLGLVLLDTPGPVSSYAEWVCALTKLDGSSTPLVILPISCKKAEMCGGAFAALCDEKKKGNLSRLKIIVVFTGIDEPFQCEGAPFEELLSTAIKTIKGGLGDSVIHFALVQCMGKGLDPADFSAHRRAEKQTLENLPDAIKSIPGMIRGVPELEKVLMRLYIERWDVTRLLQLQGVVDRDILSRRAALARMTKPITSDSIVLQLAESIALTDQQAENTNCIYSKEILRHTYEALKDVELEPVSRPSLINAIFARTQVQLEFQNEAKMREAIQSVLHKLTSKVPAVIDEMFKQYETYVSCQVSACPNSCAQLLERVLALLKEFATGTFEEPGAIAKTTEEAQKWFGCTPSVTKMRDGLKTDYKLDLPEKWSANKGPFAQRMLSELCFAMDRLHWVVCSIFFREICAAFPGWLNGRLTRAVETWSSASRDEIETTQKVVDSLVKTKETLAEIMKLLH